MRTFGSLVGLLIVALLAGLVYKFYFSRGQQPSAIGNPSETINIVGVKNDLLSIGQAERVYQTEHNSYGSLDDLVSSGAMTPGRTGRDGYTYEAESSADSFRVIARCPAAVAPGCTNYQIDQTMQVQTAP